MTASNQNVTLWRGDSLIISISVQDPDGGFIDLTSASARWWMAKNVSSSGSEIYIKKSTSEGSIEIVNVSGTDEWKLFIALEPADTENLTAGKYYHEAEVVDSEGRIFTVTTGKFDLKPTLIPDVL